ncbi:MAG: hypothetical protein EBZ47_05610 [Chlamydiae bacterium]|nr:hypothetical protein [Chlamydiota bacterium]
MKKSGYYLSKQGSCKNKVSALISFNLISHLELKIEFDYFSGCVENIRHGKEGFKSKKISLF